MGANEGVLAMERRADGTNIRDGLVELDTTRGVVS